MAIIDVVKWESNTKELVHKFPSENLRLGTQLVVHAGQTAFFVKGGQVLDEFESGTYTIKTSNIPLLGKIVNLAFGGDTPFQAEVWFVNKLAILDNSADPVNCRSCTVLIPRMRIPHMQILQCRSYNADSAMQILQLQQ